MTPSVRSDPLYSNLFEIFRGFKAMVTDAVAVYDLSMSHFAALRILDSHGSCSMSELTNDLGVTHGAATGTIDRLERDGLVLRSHSPTDRRVVQVSLTPAGQQLLIKVYERTVAEIGRRVQERSEEARSVIIQGVAELAAAFRTHQAPAQPKDTVCR